jgi:hypothetical protein
MPEMKRRPMTAEYKAVSVKSYRLVLGWKPAVI